MASIDKNLLPMPSSVAVRHNQARKQSNGGPMLFTRVPDPALVPRVFSMTWGPDEHGAVADVLRRHYEDHAAAVFTITLPRTGEAVYVRWLSGPRTYWKNAVAASTTGELEEVLAHE